MTSKESKQRKREEYEMQLFNFHTRVVNATLEDIVSRTIKNACDKLCESLINKFKPNEQDSKVLETDMKLLKKAYYLNSQPHLENIKNFVDQFISIPKHVLLQEDMSQKTQYTKEEFDNIDRELKEYQERLKNGILLNAALKEEISTLEQFRPLQDNAAELFEVIELGYKNSNTQAKLSKIIKQEELFTKFSSVSDKVKYNDIGNVEIRDFDYDCL